jgi:N-acetylglucosamine-6-phosphate deacetylase
MSTEALVNGRVLLDEGFVEDRAVLLSGGRIPTRRGNRRARAHADRQRDLPARCCCPASSTRRSTAGGGVLFQRHARRRPPSRRSGAHTGASAPPASCPR